MTRTALRHFLAIAAAVALLLLATDDLRSGDFQTSQPFRILVTNDDGVRAPGLAALADALAPSVRSSSSRRSRITARTPYGRRFFWSFFQQPTSAEADSDVQAVLDGFAGVTPLVAYEADDAAFEALKGRVR